MIKIILRKQILLPTILLLLLINGCSKKNNSSTPIDPMVKKYFSYKPGTYWIYTDSLNRRTDSFVVMKQNNTVIPDNNGGYNQETDFISIYDNGTKIDSTQWCLFK